LPADFDLSLQINHMLNVEADNRELQTMADALCIDYDLLSLC